MNEFTGRLKSIEGSLTAGFIQGFYRCQSCGIVKGAFWVSSSGSFLGELIDDSSLYDEVSAIIEIPSLGDVTVKLVGLDDVGGSYRFRGRLEPSPVS
jgi:hypothetical protein